MSDTADVQPEVLYAVEDHVATTTLDRPHRLNTISPAMLDQLASLMTAPMTTTRCAASS